MNIALLAHERRRELMVRFCIGYRNVLSQHSLLVMPNCIEAIRGAVKLAVVPCSGNSLDGFRQIISKISCHEVDLLLFFRYASPYVTITPDEIELLRICDFNSVPYATNIATAEVLIKGLERGDFDWRNAGDPMI
ncbi:MAG: methylglyoxal synthase [Oscillospiraceae bacterium]|jgi:methylglyoxal synthase|nr:methylglyoxal synthase [Oscillospiraceae bacterium]